jgi:nucleoside 2-deoxyribosyltransferase
MVCCGLILDINMIITICGSMKFYKEMRKVKTFLKELGIAAILPDGIEEEIPIEARDDVTLDDLVLAKIEQDFIMKHFKNIKKCDGILVLNYERKKIPGYIGGNTFLEIGVAFWLNKKIFLLNPVPKMDYSAEIRAMRPKVIDGDLTKIA